MRALGSTEPDRGRTTNVVSPPAPDISFARIREGETFKPPLAEPAPAPAPPAPTPFIPYGTNGCAFIGAGCHPLGSKFWSAARYASACCCRYAALAAVMKGRTPMGASNRISGPLMPPPPPPPPAEEAEDAAGIGEMPEKPPPPPPPFPAPPRLL